MTWSILARDADSGLLGLAVASKFFAVGALCPWSGGPHGAAMSRRCRIRSSGIVPSGLLAEATGPATWSPCSQAWTPASTSASSM